MKISNLLACTVLISTTTFGFLSNAAWSDETMDQVVPPANATYPDTPIYSADQAPVKKEMKAYAGLDMGTSSLGSVPSNEYTKSGYMFDVKALVSFYRPKWDFDLGLGYFSNNMSTDVRNTRVITNGVIFDGEAQYRFTPRLQIGPVVNLLAGTDVSFSESDNQSNTFNLMAGLGAKYAIPVNPYELRAIAQIQTSITDSSRRIVTFQLGIQFGFSVANY